MAPSFRSKAVIAAARSGSTLLLPGRALRNRTGARCTGPRLSNGPVNGFAAPYPAISCGIFLTGAPPVWSGLENRFSWPSGDPLENRPEIDREPLRVLGHREMPE